ncbi:tannase/feruloyl esterase family alpha/beta hydrolase [Streptomyces sp. NBC_01498]|uniref:DUF6351 family protein n=1 Tax=Streptomyces sp. NBC_01498 TaxID=2975870 RepID=UPI002E7AE080|nr:DUF6351 family protein [Streptomyces sp. NBC_01498]WTL28312.1 tannase/feruloyl esterase family alpha/beta hydrolase [Streptomyces sp. NBC_01498]
MSRRPVLALVLTLGALLPTALPSAAVGRPGDGPGGGAARLTVETVSTRPSVVTGGDVLVRVGVPRGIDPGDVRITRDGTDVTEAFTPDGAGAGPGPGPGAIAGAGSRALTGLVTSLREGRNRLVAAVPGRPGARAALTVRDHPATGPVISGPHERPFVCGTERFTLVDGSTLGPPLDADCSVTTRVDHAYRSTDGTVKPLADPASRPPDLATTTTSTGARVPFLIRVETGTLNRGVYQISMLADPAAPAPTRTRPSEGWNGRLMYTFGGGCRGGWYTQGSDTGGVLDTEMLGRGYAVASSSLNVFGNNCNDLLASETVMTVKEHFTERYGVPRFTIGWGCSGGSYQSYQTADNYPGLLDGIIVGCSFPDVTSATNTTLLDARLLDHYFTATAPGTFSAEQQTAVAGFRERASIPNLSDGAKRLDPDAEFPAALPEDQRYDALTRPDGARGTVFDHTVNVYGRDRRTGAALRPLDNTGVQYGLDALNRGVIDTRRFLDLNARVGGIDRDAGFTPGRTAADRTATEAAYGTGRILWGGAGLAATPVVDHRSYTDDLPGGDIHMAVHGYSTRARLVAANGHADNQVMLAEDNRYGFSLRSPALRHALTEMDAWLTTLTARAPRAEWTAREVVAHKPAGLTDACWTGDPEPRKIAQRLSYDNAGTCGTLYPAFPTPRLVAGAPLADDVIACRRKAVDPADYAVRFTGAELRELRAVFAGGVCDWARSGVGQRPLSGTWQSVGPADPTAPTVQGTRTTRQAPAPRRNPAAQGAPAVRDSGGAGG